MSDIRIGILTASDRASAGVYEDLSGKAIIDTLKDYLTSKWEPVYRVIPDDQHVVEGALIELADKALYLAKKEGRNRTRSTDSL